MKNLNDNIKKVQNQIGYQFKNEDLLYQAFTRMRIKVVQVMKD